MTIKEGAFMTKIGIIGCENSHANGFAELFNKEKAYEGFTVTAVGGHYKEANEALRQKYGISEIYDDFRKMAGRVDAVIVTARDGKYHASFADPFIEAGLPVFIDKPFTVDYKEAIETVNKAERSGSLLCGGSSLKYTRDVQYLKEIVSKGDVRGGMVAAPVHFDSEYSGFYFYAPHLAEMSLEIFGKSPVSVYAAKSGKDVTVLTRYKDYCVTNHFGNLANNSYFGGVITTAENFMRKIDISEGLRLETEAFVEMIKSGRMNRSYKELTLPVKYMNAIVESYTKAKEIILEE